MLWIEAQADAVASRQALSVARERTHALQEEHAAQRSHWDVERTRLGERAEANERRLMLELDAARESIKSLQQERKQVQRQLQDAETGLAAMTEAQHAMRAAKALQDAVVARLREQVSAQEALAATYQSMLAAPMTLSSGRGNLSGKKRRVSHAGVPTTSVLRRVRRP